MLIHFRVVGVFLFLGLLPGCGPGAGDSNDHDDIVIMVRDEIVIRSLDEAVERSVVIQAAYDPALPNIELIVCIPRPDTAPDDASATFDFSFYDGETMLVSKSVPSVIEANEFETFSLYLNVEFFQKLRVHMTYLDTDAFKAVGDLTKSYSILFDEIADVLIESEKELSDGRDPLRPPPLPTCFDLRDR